MVTFVSASMHTLLLRWRLALQAFRGFAGTSVLIMVGVATDTTRRLRAERAMTQYGDMDTFYESGVSVDDVEN